MQEYHVRPAMILINGDKHHVSLSSGSEIVPAAKEKGHSHLWSEWPSEKF
jgi:hypothetical protein